MARLIYWMGFQILIGIWLFISPYVLGQGEVMAIATNNMIFGAVVILVGLGIALFGEKVCAGVEHSEKKTA